MTVTDSRKWVAPSLAVVGLTAVLVLFFCDPERVPIYPQCVFHEVTGLDCPGCGSLRAMHALLHGRIAAAIEFNAFLMVSLPLFAALGWIGWRRRGGRGPAFRIQPRWMWLYFAAYLLFGIVRDLPVPVFALFAPQ